MSKNTKNFVAIMAIIGLIAIAIAPGLLVFLSN